MSVFYQKEDKETIRCLVCPHRCLIANGKRGICGVRKNDNGKIKLLTYGKAAGMNLDPIEKKPLFHFLPGSYALSFGTLGCNFRCDFCQNWTQSQIVKGPGMTKRIINRYSKNYDPQEIVNLAIKLKSPTVAYTYNEPIICIEYALETMKLAKKANLKNIWVSNGFINPKPRKTLLGLLDGINVDLKSFDNNFYQKICGGKIKPVLESIKWFWENKIWIEVTTLIIPGENDSEKELKQIAQFLKDISPDIPWHLTAFHPDYRMLDKPATPSSKLISGWEIGKKAGLNFVYIGNVVDEKHSSTYCPKCHKLLIRRGPVKTEITSNFENGRCKNCNYKIPGVWQ